MAARRKARIPDIYDVHGRLTTRIRSVENALPGESARLIMEFLDHCGRNRLSEHRLLFYLNVLAKAGILMGPAFPRPTRKDVEKAVAAVDAQDSEEWTKSNFRTGVKRFYKWHLGNDEDYPPEVRWIRTRPRRSKLPKVGIGDLLTREEVRSLVKACMNPRDRALISLVDDSGCRIGEVLHLRIGDATFDRYGVVVQVPEEGKTGGRRVRVIGESIAHLAAWLEAHPARDDPTTPLFVGMDARTRDRAMNYAQARKVLQTAAARAGLKKRVHWHLFRHGAATRLAAKVTEAPLEAQMGWVPGSEMTRVYVHLSGRDVDSAILKANGVQIEEKPEQEEPPVKPCLRCGVPNAASMDFCRRCGLPLNAQAALTIEKDLQTRAAVDVMSFLREHPDLSEHMTAILQALHRESVRNETDPGGPVGILPLPRKAAWELSGDLEKSPSRGRAKRTK